MNRTTRSLFRPPDYVEIQRAHGQAIAGLMPPGTVLVGAWQASALRVIVTHTPDEGWHLSISHTTRYPNWDEIADARYRFLPPELTFALLLPPKVDYVNLHETTFHLHEIRDGRGSNLPFIGPSD